ncbi:MAG: CBS domain-containing protein [Lachnospiraceae bacterium]|nr:CBS domain-containing protein [Lachnospiraceae bacterium]
MNILFFLTPKSEVAHIHDDNSLEEALCKMEQYQYTAVPMIDRKGHYVGTITEGDAMWYIRHHELWKEDLTQIPVTAVSRRMDNRAVSIDVNIEDLVAASMMQNFIPVVDDDEIFIGIVKRKDIINYCFQNMQHRS